MNLQRFIERNQKPVIPPPSASNESTSDAFERYSRLDEPQLMQELFRVGNHVSPAELDAFYSNVSAYLTPEQAAKMRDLIRQLKG